MMNDKLLGWDFKTLLDFAPVFLGVCPLRKATVFLLILMSLRGVTGKVMGQTPQTQGRAEIPLILQLSEGIAPDKAPQEEPLALAMSRRIVLEDWTAYRNEQGIWVRGQIRNTARSPLRSPLHAIAEFYTTEGHYLGSQEALVSPRPLPLDLVGSFEIVQQPEDKPKAEVVRLRFRVTLAQNQGEINFTPTTRKPLTLKINNLPEQ